MSDGSVALVDVVDVHPSDIDGRVDAVSKATESEQSDGLE
jgi:hypothetical protein